MSSLVDDNTVWNSIQPDEQGPAESLKKTYRPLTRCSSKASLPPMRNPSLLSHPTDRLDTRALRSLIRQMNAALRDGAGGGLLERFEHISILLFLKLLSDQESQSNELTNDPDNKVSLQKLESQYQAATAKHPFLNAFLTFPKRSDGLLAAARLLSTVDLRQTTFDIKGFAYEELIRNTFDKSEHQQFFTPRPVVSFMVGLLDASPQATLCDPACGSGGFLIEALKQGHRSQEIVGMEIDPRMAWVAQMNLLIHGGEGTQIVHAGRNGSLGTDPLLDAPRPADGFDVILTNPPFGSDFADTEALSQFRLGEGRTNRRRGALFVERCIDWLKPGTGRLAIVLDDSLLNGTTNEDVRALILNTCEVEAVISLPEQTFKPYASVTTSILLMRKRAAEEPAQQGPVFMAAAKEVGRKTNGDPLYRHRKDGTSVLHNDLDTILTDWRLFKTGEPPKSGSSSFVCSGPIFQDRTGTDNRLDVLFHHPSCNAADEALARSPHPTPSLAELVSIRRDAAIPSADGPHALWRYVGLAHMATQTGAYRIEEVFGSTLKSMVRRFEPGDVVFAKLRPALRKVFFADETENGYVSSECLVLQPTNPDLLLPRYLALMLRSDLVYGQLVYQTRGTGRPRVSKKTKSRIPQPLPVVK